MNLTYKDIIKAADSIRVHPATIMAVIMVETPSPHVGDLRYGKPLILNERHWFYKLSSNFPVSSHFPALSNPKAGGYCGGANWKIRQECEHQRLQQKMSIFDGLLKEPALKSISMGLFQIMGFNHNIIGYNNVFSMWEDAKKVEDTIDLYWFIEFIKAKGLIDELQRKDFAGFARIYNGISYKANKYDSKLKYNYDHFFPIFEEYRDSLNIIRDIKKEEENPRYMAGLYKITPAPLQDLIIPYFSQEEIIL